MKITNFTLKQLKHVKYSAILDNFLQCIGMTDFDHFDFLSHVVRKLHYLFMEFLC